MASFPASIVAPTDPTSGNTLNSPDHAGEHQSHNAEIVAVETKIGTGASTATSGKVLRATGTGTSAWAQVDPSTDVAALSSTTLRSLLTDETGTGVAVFGTAPTISAPVVSTGTFASPMLTTPAVVTSINDANGNEVIKTPATASATNEITVTNAANGNSPTISATGSSDSNVDLTLTPKGTGTIKTSPVNRIDWTALPLGSVVQEVFTNFSTVFTGTTLIPSDDTIPQITEGTEFITQAITPKSTTNILVIDAELFLSNSLTTPTITAAIFQDATANALAAMSNLAAPIATGTVNIRVRHTMAAGTISSTTFRVRAGADGASTNTFNGQGGARRYGGITLSSIRITEYKA